MKHYVIIGGSAAGLAAAEAIRRKSQDAKITVVSDEPGRPYSRPLLSFALDGSIERGGLFIRPEDYCASWDFECFSGRKAEGVEPNRGQVVLDDGRKLDYDALLIATGTRSKPLNIQGIDLKGVCYFRTKDDMDKVDAYLKDTTQAVVVGGGLVGIKVTDALQKRGVKVTVLITSDFPLSRIADQTSASMVADVLGEKGVHFMTGVSPAGVQGKNERVAQVITDNGQTIPCQLVVVGKGVVPNKGFLEGSGIHVSTGIETDSRLSTNILNVFAAGDVAETRDLAWEDPRLHALWPAAVEQGRIAGCNMSGEAIDYPGTINCNALRAGDLHIVSGGIVDPPPGDRYQSFVYHDPATLTYKKIVTTDNRIVGMIFVNDIASAGVVLRLIKQKRNLATLSVDPLSPGFNVGQLSFRM